MSPRTRVTRGCSLTTLAVMLLVVVGSVAALPVVAAAPPPPPAAYYGGLTIGGSPAPVGTTLTATIGGEVRGQLTTDVTGRYGEAGGFGSKLIVSGTEADTGSEVKFRVGNRIVGSTTWASGDVREIDLRTSPVNTGGSAPDTTGSSTGLVPVTTPVPIVDPTVTSVRTTDGISLAVTGARANQSTTLDTDSIGDSEIALDRLGLTPSRDGDFAVNVTYTNTPSDTPSFDISAGGVTLGYFVIDHTIPDEDISEVTFDFRVGQQRLQTAGLSPNDVVLGRYNEGAWTPLETTLVETAGGFHRYQVTSPGLSVFAIGSRGTVATPTETVTETPTLTATQTPTETESTTEPVTQSVTTEPATVTETATPGFGVMTALVALLTVLAVTSRRYD